MNLTRSSSPQLPQLPQLPRFTPFLRRPRSGLDSRAPLCRMVVTISALVDSRSAYRSAQAPRLSLQRESPTLSCSLPRSPSGERARSASRSLGLGASGSSE